MYNHRTKDLTSKPRGKRCLITTMLIFGCTIRDMFFYILCTCVLNSCSYVCALNRMSISGIAQRRTATSCVASTNASCFRSVRASSAWWSTTSSTCSTCRRMCTTSSRCRCPSKTQWWVSTVDLVLFKPSKYIFLL